MSFPSLAPNPLKMQGLFSIADITDSRSVSLFIRCAHDVAAFLVFPWRIRRACIPRTCGREPITNTDNVARTEKIEIQKLNYSLR